MSVYEFIYNNKKICNQCRYLKLDKDSMWEGFCICTTNKIRDRRRNVTDKCCSSKIIKNESEDN